MSILLAMSPERQTIPVFGSIPPDREDESEPCQCCGEEPDDCSCSHCDGCDSPTDEPCENCEACPDCCECATCARSRCGRRVESTCSRCDRCPDCCECWHCQGCDEPCESTCGECDRCPDCCECHYCQECDRTISDDDEWCFDCDNCTSCCECGSECDEPDRWIDSQDFTRVTTRRYLSVELEISETRDKDKSCTVRACSRHGIEEVGDGSLSGDNPFELNTPPARGDRFAAMVDDLSAALAADGARINTSCGFHVHVDARDYNHHDIGRLIEVYARIESTLFSVVSPSRRENRYCGRCGSELLRRLQFCRDNEWNDPDRITAKTVYNGHSDELRKAKRNKYRDDRYAALNLHSWVYRGTVECRLHQGTFDADRIRNWAHLWGSILDYCKTSGAESLPDDPWDALMAVAPTDEVRDWLRSRREKFSPSLSCQES